MSQTQKLTDKQVGTYLVYRMKLNELIHLHFLFRHLQSGGCGGAIHGVDPQIVLNTIRTSALAWFIVEFSFFYCPARTKVRLEPTSEEYRLEFAWLANLVTLGYLFGSVLSRRCASAFPAAAAF